MRDNTGYRLLIPHSWEKIPMAPHGFIIQDKVWQLYYEPRNWNKYYSPSCERKKAVREMSGRNVVAIRQRKKQA